MNAWALLGGAIGVLLAEAVAEELDEFREYFKPGMTYGIVARRRQGKSWLAAFLSSFALDRQDYVVASNILCKKWVRAPEEPKGGHWEEAYPRAYFKVESYYGLFRVIEQAFRHELIVLFVLDEAGAMAKGFQKGETSLQAHVRDNVAFMAIASHLRVCTLILSQSLENVGTSFRSYEGGLLDCVITKPYHPGYSPQEVAEFTWDDESTSKWHVEDYGLAHTEEWAKESPGRIVYSDQVAAFDRGKYPGTNIDFRLRELLDDLSGQLPDKYPDIIRWHLEHPPEIGKRSEPAQERPATPNVNAPRDTADVEAKKERARELLSQGVSQRAVATLVGLSKSEVNYISQALRGKLRQY